METTTLTTNFDKEFLDFFEQILSDELSEKAALGDFFDAIAEKTQNNFAISYLYPWQRLVIANILDDTEDAPLQQIVLLPTGAGKSLCFLVPTLFLAGPTLIIYPLLALMSDQERRIKEAKIPVAIFKGNQSKEEREENYKKLEKGVKIILANPEILQNEQLKKRLQQAHIAHIAIDESHCVCEWGETFRPSYLTLGTLIKELDIKKATAFTATASDYVLQRINEILFENEAHIVRGDTDRPNIHYSLIPCYSKDITLLSIIDTVQKPLIIFCGTRHQCEKTARMLAFYFFITNTELANTVKFYHAGMTKEEKKAIEDWFFTSNNGILVCTCAFGMGIDKANIRTVIHRDCPNTVEAYVQEAGRGGRDKAKAEAILLWNYNDYSERKKLSDTDRKKQLFFFATAQHCRREVLVKALGGELSSCEGCDICDNKKIKRPLDGEKILKIIQKNKGLLTEEELLLNLQQNLSKEKDSLQKNITWEKKFIDDILQQLFLQKRIVKRGFFPFKKRIWLSNNYHSFS
ncbi:MAG: ATP-dependent DNA helicase RecQ [Spirochaetaceae bacterium]|nr:ATP-dependent DNA helicase RecQ [Spirochaetaceae bacterium]